MAFAMDIANVLVAVNAYKLTGAARPSRRIFTAVGVFLSVVLLRVLLLIALTSNVSVAGMADVEADDGWAIKCLALGFVAVLLATTALPTYRSYRQIRATAALQDSVVH